MYFNLNIVCKLSNNVDHDRRQTDYQHKVKQLKHLCIVNSGYNTQLNIFLSQQQSGLLGFTSMKCLSHGPSYSWGTGPSFP